VKVLAAEADDADRRHEQRAGEADAEQVDRQVPLVGSVQHPRDDPVARERRDVGALGPFVAAAARHIGMDPRGKDLARLTLERREVDGVVGDDPFEAVEVDVELAIAVLP
jgi:hypothetical protein